MIAIAAIKASVARHYGVPVRVMTDRVQDHQHAQPRNVAMTLTARLTGHGDTRIGHLFGGRHRSTVRKNVRFIEHRLRSDDRMSSIMRAVTKELLLPRGLI